MSILGRAVLFVARELVAPALRNAGEHIGAAFDRRVGTSIDPTYTDDAKEKVASDDDPGEDVDHGVCYCSTTIGRDCDSCWHRRQNPI